MMKRILLILAVVLIATPASAQLPSVQVYGQDTGTLRAVSVNASGQLSITCANCSGSGASAVDDAAFTVATDSGAPAAFLFDDVAPDSVDEGDAGVARMSANRNVYVTIRDAAGNERGLNIDANGALAVTGGGAGTQYTEGDTDATIVGTALMLEGAADALVAAPGTAADGLLVNLGTNNDVSVTGTVTVTDGAGSLNVICDSGCSGGTQFAEDVSHTTGDTGTVMLGVRRDTAATSAITNGDYVTFNMDANGRLWTIGAIDTALPAGNNNIGDVDVNSGALTSVGTVTSLGSITTSVTPGTAASNLGKAEDSVAATGDVGVGAMAVRVDVPSAAMATANGDYLFLSTDFLGRLWTSGGYIEDSAHSSTDTVVSAGTVRRDTTPSSSAGTAGDYATMNTDANGRLYTNAVLYNSSGTELTLNSDVTEDAAETAGGSGPMVLSVRRDSLATSASTSGDNATFNTNANGALYTQPTAGTSGGADSYRRNSAGSTEDEHEVKASAGILYSVTVTNTNAAVRFLRCANQVAASTTPGTTTPIIDLAIPGATTGAGITFPFPVGLSFSTGLTCWFVTGAADTDVAEVAANEIKALYTYK